MVHNGMNANETCSGNVGKRKPKADSLKRELSEFLIRSGAVKFGSFKLKSGRVSPYFVNLGAIGDGARMSELGAFYARAIVDAGLAGRTDMLFGPSYKGVPIAVSTSVALHRDHGISMRFSFNRKEAKDHGEGGMIVGSALRDGDRVGILDDVMTTGKTKEEVLNVIRSAAKVEISYIMIAVDRLERGETEMTATREFEQRYGIRVLAIVDINDVLSTALSLGLASEGDASSVRAYLAEYGGKAR